MNFFKAFPFFFLIYFYIRYKISKNLILNKKYILHILLQFLKK